MRRFFIGVLAIAFLATTTSCDDGREQVIPESGTLSSNPFFFVIDDGAADNVSGITVGGVQEGKNTSFIITDADKNILGLPKTMEDLENENFEGASAGDCYIWYISYNDSVTGLDVGNSIESITGLFDISNSVKIERVNTPEAGMLTGGPFTFTVGDGMADTVSGIANSSTALSGKTESYLIIDDAGKILEVIKEGVDADTEEELTALEVLEKFDFDGAAPGDCLIWYIRYEGELDGLEKDKMAADIAGKTNDAGAVIGIYDLSNSITVTRN